MSPPPAFSKRPTGRSGSTPAATTSCWSRRTPTSTDLAFVNGPPPKVIWLRVGNTPTNDITQLLAAASVTITSFVDDDHDVVLTIRATAEPSDIDAR
jgi:hypothetical protein